MNHQEEATFRRLNPSSSKSARFTCPGACELTTESIASAMASAYLDCSRDLLVDRPTVSSNCAPIINRERAVTKKAKQLKLDQSRPTMITNDVIG